MALVQGPLLIGRICFTLIDDPRNVTCEIPAVVDPVLFALMYECVVRIGYWLYEDDSEETDNTLTWPLNVWTHILARRPDPLRT